jgi:cytochrome b561
MAIHWLTVIVVTVVFAMAIGREWVDDKLLRQALLQWHRYAGLTVFVLAWARVPIRLMSSKPDHGFGKATRAWVASGHGLLYLALMATPAIGYLLMCARVGHVDLFGMPLPTLIERDRDLAESLEAVHACLGWGMAALIGLHAAMALWHHHLAKDQVLRSMLPSRR